MTRNTFREHAIAIRRRDEGELIDLAFCVVREHWREVFFYFFVVAIPVLILNFAVYTFLGGALRHLSVSDSRDALTFFVWEEMFAAMFIELTFVGSLLEAWLGLWVFNPHRHVGTREVFALWYRGLPQLLFYFVLLWPLYVLTSEFMPCIILLERTPFFAGRTKRMSTSRRSYALHGGWNIPAEKFGTWIVVIFLAIAGFFILQSFGGLLLPDQAWILWDNVFALCLFPLYLWSLFMFMSVYSFLRYLNTRIITEGWDVEIEFKAEIVRRLGDMPRQTLPGVTLDMTDEFGVSAGSDENAPPSPETQTGPQTGSQSAYTIGVRDDLADLPATEETP